MCEKDIQYYKPAKTLDEQIEYLEANKRVRYNITSKADAASFLGEYSYVNVITPYKHRFADKDKNKEVIKIDDKHVYSRDVEFDEYKNAYLEERNKYPNIYSNLAKFEVHFKSCLAYHVLTTESITNSDQLSDFLDKTSYNIQVIKLSELGIGGVTSTKKNTKYDYWIADLEEAKDKIFNYADIYCFFDRLSLGTLLAIYVGVEKIIQKMILRDLRKWDCTLGANTPNDFINNFFTAISIRNCVMHCNSLEILVRFYDPKNHKIRGTRDKKKFQKMINYLSK